MAYVRSININSEVNNPNTINPVEKEAGQRPESEGYPFKYPHVRTAVSFPHVYRLCEQLVRDEHPGNHEPVDEETKTGLACMLGRELKTVRHRLTGEG